MNPNVLDSQWLLNCGAIFLPDLHPCYMRFYLTPSKNKAIDLIFNDDPDSNWQIHLTSIENREIRLYLRSISRAGDFIALCQLLTGRNWFDLVANARKCKGLPYGGIQSPLLERDWLLSSGAIELPEYRVADLRFHLDSGSKDRRAIDLLKIYGTDDWMVYLTNMGCNGQEYSTPLRQISKTSDFMSLYETLTGKNWANVLIDCWRAEA